MVLIWPRGVALIGSGVQGIKLWRLGWKKMLCEIAQSGCIGHIYGQSRLMGVLTGKIGQWAKPKNSTSDG